MTIISILLALTLLFGVQCRENIIKGVTNLSKVYKMQNGLWNNLASNRNTVMPVGIHNISITFPESIVTFVGPSKSGKSTLTKCIIGLETVSSGEIIWNSAIAKQKHIFPGHYCSYVNHLFRMSYNDECKIIDLLNLYRIQNSVNDNCNETFNKVFIEALQKFGIKREAKANTLLVSQRLSLEVLIAISRSWYKRQSNNGTALDQYRREDTNEQPTVKHAGYMVVLDEYLDKEVTSVRDTFFQNMHYLANDPFIMLQMIVITHSRGVMKKCVDYSIPSKGFGIVLRNGQVYSHGEINRLVLPSEMNWIA